MLSLFESAPDDDGLDPAYLETCRHETKQEAREALDRAWQVYGHFLPEAPAHFQSEFRRNFHSRSWELFLLSVFGNAGFELQRPPPKGPDLKLRLATGQTCWIEAVVPNVGTGQDKPFQRPPGDFVGSLYKVDGLLLRYLSALTDKLADLNAYRAARIIGEEDAALIAINSGAILDAGMHDLELPAVVKAVLPIGESVTRITPYSDEPPHEEWTVRSSVERKSGAKIPTTLFLEESSAAVSGVLFASHNVWDLPWQADKALRLVHNRNALAALPRGSLPTRGELWDENEQLLHRGNCARFGYYASEPPIEPRDCDPKGSVPA